MKGNQIAQALVQACMIESIERRADKEFEFQRTEEEYNRRWSDKFEEILNALRQDIEERRLLSDDLYYPDGIN